MKCLECNTSDFEYDEVMGETACKECGLIVATEMFEERQISVDKEVLKSSSERTTQLGSVIAGKGKMAHVHNRYSSRDNHIRKAIVLGQLVLSSVFDANTSLRDRVGEVYRELHSKNTFKGVSLEVRATAVVWFVMKENKTPITAKKASQEFNCSGKSLNRLIRKINSYYGSRMRHLQPDPQYLLKKVANQITDDIVFISQCMETLELFEPIVISSDYNKTPAYYESICWISKNIFVYPRITLKLIAEKSDASWSAIQKQTKVLLGLIGLKTCAQVKGKQISELERRE
tara:strand:- start:865 stop:1728 length:864 start_codon:yes stop_codon:yes gene_type:complete